MANKYGNRIKVSVSTTGTGSTITLGSAVSGFQTFANGGISDAETVRYVLEDGANFEIGTGTYTASGTTLTRSVIESNNSNNAINLSGNAVLFIAPASSDIAFTDGATFTGDVTFDGATAGRDIDFDRSDNALKFADNTKLKFGSDPNLEIYHDGGSSYIDDIGSGSLAIRTNGFSINMMSNTSEWMGKFVPNGNVELYYDNAKKFETSSSGINVTGTVIDDGATHDGDVTFTGSSYSAVWDKSDSALEFADNAKARFGTGNDLEVYHASDSSYIDEVGGGSLFIRTNGPNVFLGKTTGSEYMAVFTPDGAVSLRYDNATKFETSSLGVSVTGNIAVTGTVDGRDVATDGSKLDGIAVGANVGISDLVDDTSPQLGGTLQTNGNSISAVTNGDVVLVANGTGSNGFVKIKNYFGNEVFRIASGGQIGLQGGANYGTSGQFLKSLGPNAGPQWASISAIGSLVEDTSPQLGGDLDLNGRAIESSGTAGSLTFGTVNNVDSLKLSYTSAGDSEIFGNKIVAKANTSFRVLNNSGTEKFKLDTSTGNLTLSGTVDGRDIAANLPASLGSAGQFLKVSSGGASTEWTAAPSPDTFSDNKEYGSLPTTAGSDSFTIGVSATCAGDNSYALGVSATCAGNDAASMGKFAAAGAQNSAAVGYNASSAGDSSLAVGYGSAVASNSAFGTAVGYEAEVAASSFQAVALGRSYVSGSYATSINIGDHSSSYGALASKAIAIGYQAKASHTNAISIGATVESTNSDQLNLGSTGHTVRISESYTLPTSDGSANQVLTTNGSGVVSFASVSGGASASADLYIANPNNSTSPTAAGSQSIAIGSAAACAGDNAFSIGLQARAATESIGLGFQTHADGLRAIAIGHGTDVDSEFGLGIGYSVDIPSNSAQAMAIGYDASISSNQYGAMAIGHSAIGAGQLALALGRSRAAGADSCAIGIGSNSSSYGTSANESVALGYQAKASGSQSNALGAKAVAAGTNSTALSDSYAGGLDSFAAGIADNSTSYGAAGNYSLALGYHAKAHGSQSMALGYLADVGTSQDAIAIGTGATISGTSTAAIAIGKNAKAQSGGAIAIRATYIGSETVASGRGSVAIGDGIKAAQIGKYAFGLGRFAATGDAQGGMFILRCDTTDATATRMTTDNATAASSNQIVAAQDTCITFSGTVVAMQNGAQAYGSWKIEGLIVNDYGALTIPNSAITVIHNSSNWGLALSADDTWDALAITVTGEASHNIRWVANITTAEVTFA